MAKRKNTERLVPPQLTRKIALNVQDIIEHYTKIILADPNELIQHRRVCCHYCHGINFEYQWIEGVYLAKGLRAIDQRDEPPPEALGGFGFDGTRSPHPDCPRCFGEGNGQVFIPDTRNLSENAKVLYAGLKMRGDGVEMILKSQEKALENLAKILGMFKITFEVSEKGTPELVPIDKMTMLPIEAARVYQAQISGG